MAQKRTSDEGAEGEEATYTLTMKRMTWLVSCCWVALHAC